MRSSNSILVHATATEVFEYLACLEYLPRWNPAIQETRKISPGPVGAGSEYRQLRTLPNPMEEKLEIEIYEPGRRLVVRGGFGPLAGTSSYVLDPLGDDTRLTNEMELHATGVLGPLAAVATWRIRGAVSQNLTVLKGLLEGTTHDKAPSP